MEKKKLNFAIIGCGRIGNRHAGHIKNVGNLLAVCDIDKVKSKNLGKLYHAKSYTGIDKLLEKETGLDVVSICTPNGLHATHTIKALKAGNHVLCEKPMCINVYECGEMIKASEIANRRLFIVKQNRFNPPVVAVKKRAVGWI